MLKKWVHLLLKNRAVSLQKEIVLIGTCFKPTFNNMVLLDDTEQSLEDSYYWYDKTESSQSLPMKNGGFLSIVHNNAQDLVRFTHYIATLQGKNQLPVILSNSCESFTECLAALTDDHVGIINISHQLNLADSMSSVPMQGYVSVLSQHADIGMFCLGVNENYHSSDELSLAKQMGINWINSYHCYDQEYQLIYENLQRFMNEFPSLAIHLDLNAIVRMMAAKVSDEVNLQMLLNLISVCLASEKVRLIQLTARNENALFSKETKGILDTIRLNRHLSGQVA